MLKKCKLISMLFLVCLFVAGIPYSHCLAENLPERNILIMHANTQDYPVHEAFNKGLKEKFQQQSQYKIIYSYEYLDLTRYNNVADYFADTAHYFSRKYLNKKPDMIITSSTLVPFLLQYGKEIFPGVPMLMVWPGNDFIPEVIPANAVGISGGFNSRQMVAKNIQLILQTRPRTKRIYIVVGDSEEERNIIQKTLSLADEYANQVELVFLNRLPTAAMRESLRNSSDDSAILFAQWFRDVEGHKSIPAQVLQEICQEVKIPVYTISEHTIGSGTLGGYVYNFTISGQKAAEVGLVILSGKKASDIVAPVVSGAEYAFDWRELKRWNITETKLPPGSRIEYKEPSVWELYKGYIIAGIVMILLEALLIFSLGINLIRRRKAENKLAHLNATLEKRVLKRTQELQNANDQLKIAQEQLTALNKSLDLTARTDSLTGLYNRRHMEEKIREAYEQYQRTGSEFALVIVDIDFFKEVNDVYGHDVGDCLLKLISEDIRKSIRENDIVARWGGEEFLLLLPATNGENAMGLAERIRTKVEEGKYSCGCRDLSATLTLGVSTISSEDMIVTLIKKADIALYQGKRAGRNRVMMT